MTQHKKNFLKIAMLLTLIASACDSSVRDVTPTLVSNSTNTLTTPYSATPPMTPTSELVLKATFSPMNPALQSQFYDLLRNNRNCELPCFWGIKPGETSWMDAKMLFEPYAVAIVRDSIRSTPTGTKYYVQVQTEASGEDESWMIMNVSLDINDADLVRTVLISFEEYSNGELTINDKYLSHFSLRNIFLQNGLPDAIYLYAGESASYSLSIVYNSQKMVFELAGEAKELSTGKYEICPNFDDGDVTSMKIAVASLTDSIDVKTVMGYPFWEGIFPFEEITGMSIDDFYRLTISDQQPACILTRVSQP